MVNESTKWLYEQLTRQGYNVGKDLGEFEGLMKTNAQSRQWAYETAKKSGLNVGKDIDEFTSLVAPPAPKPAQQPVPKPAQQPAQQPVPKPAQQPAPKPAQQPVTQGAPTEAAQQAKQELTVTKPAAHQPVAKQNTATSVAGEPTRYFRLRRGGSDFVVSEAEVKAAGGLKAWADKHHGAPVRVYMSGTDKDGKSFNGHVSIDEAHKRRVENGYRYNMTNGTSYPEQVAAARQSDRIEKVLDGLWSEAEANTKKDIEAVTKSEMDNYVMLGGGRENRMVASAGMAHGKQVAYLRNFDIEKMAQNAVNRLSSNNGAGGDASRPLTEEEKRQQEEFYQQVYNQVYNYAVAKNAPKSTVEFFMRKVMDANVLASISKGLARSAAGVGDGLIKANEQAMGEYEKKHRAVGIMGTVTGMAIDPVTAVSALAGGAVAKGAISIGGKIIAPKVAAPVASRLFASTAAGRLTGAIAGSVGNFATYEGIKDAEMQFKHGGRVNENGETEDYSLGSVIGSMVHGAVLGSVMGVGGAMIGNVADKAVKATTSTAGKVGVRAAEFGAGTLFNGTIFAADGYMQTGEFDLLHGIATDLGFKASHAIKTAPQRIASMRPIKSPRTMAERNHNRMSFEEHLRKNLDASPADAQFTKEDREELRRYGYGELADVFAKSAKPKEATVENPNNLPEVRVERVNAEEISTGGEFDGYDAMERLMQDDSVPETIRAKAYYIFTGKAVPVSTVIGYREDRNDEDGTITVNSVNAQGGVVTSRRFTDEKQAEAERNNIMRQAELNTIDMGERFKEAEADEKVLQSAINKVSPGADYKTVRQIYKDVKSGKEGITDSQRQLASAIDMALEHSKGEADADRPAAIRERLNKELNGDVEGALKKISTDRTEAEQALVERYAEELYPKQEKTPQQEEAESMHQYGKELYGRVYEGDSDARADIEAINVRVEEARGMCAEAFGDDAEYWLGRLDENPWDVVDMPTLTEGQRDAALYYINSKAAQEGVQAAQADAIEARRAEVESSVRRRTHRDRGTIQPAVMKVDDRRVYVVKGDVVMFPDGTAVDHNNSSESIIVCDAETGEFRFASPWDILRMEEAVDPQVELDAAFAQIDAEESELLSPSESVPNIEENPDEAVSALSRIPVDEQTGEPLFEQAPDHETAWDGLLEAVGGDTKDAVEIAQAQADAIAVELRKLAGKAPRLSGSPMQMAAQKREHQGKIEALQGRLEIWNGILGVNNTREAAERERLHDEAQRRFEERQRIEAEDAAEQATVGTNAVNPKIKAKWENANKVEGVEDVLTLADGSTIRGRYVLTEAGAATASHDVNNAFAPSEGFPIDRNGQSVNDRDYERDMDAQRIVQSIADSYDNRALQTPVIVSRDGIVLSGNNRTMSGDMAARQGTDKAYVDYLREFAGKYGFTPEQVEGMKNPRVAFVPNEDLPYDASTFARFNAQEMKSQSKPEAAVKLGKTVPDDVFNGIVNEISCYDRLSEYYANERAVAQALGALQQAGVINEKQMPEMRTGAAVSAAGRELIENTLIGKVFQASPDAVRQIIGNVTLREAIIMGLTEIASNRTLANGYDLSDELAKAVNLVTRAKASLPDVYKRGVPVSPFGRQTGLFDDEFGDGRVTDGVVLMLADVLNSGKPSELRKMLVAYNREAQSAASGQMDIFSGAVPPKEEVMNLTIESFRNATPKEQQAIVDAAIADRKRRAAQRAGAETAGEAVDAAESETRDVPTGISGDARGMGKRSGDMAIERRSLSKEEAQALVKALEDGAEEAMEIPLTIENWDALFGESGVISTPIEDVVMGENQFVKLCRLGRKGKLGMVKPTLENPDIVVEEQSQAKEGQISERDSSRIYIKSFTDKNGKRTYHFTSVTVKRDGNEIVISNQEKSPNRIANLLQKGSLLWVNTQKFEIKASSASETQKQSEVSAEDSQSATQASLTDSLGINSSKTSGRKGSKFLSEKQAEEEKSLIGLADGILEKMSEANARRLSELDRRVAELEAEERVGKNREIELSEAGDELLALTDEFDVEELDMIAVKYPAAIRRVGYARDRRAAEKRSREVLEMRKNEEMNALRELYDKAEPLPAHDKKPKKFAVTEYVSTDKRDPKHFFGVYHSSTGEAVATDKAVLIVSKADYKPEHKGKVVTKKGEDVTNDLRSEMLSEHGAKYVDYTRVIPTGEAEATAPLSDAAVQAACGVTVKKRNEAYIILDFGEGRLISMDMYNWQLFVRGANYIGATEVEYRGEDRPLIARSEKGTVLSMPYQHLKEADKPIYRQDFGAALVIDPWKASDRVKFAKLPNKENMIDVGWDIADGYPSILIRVNDYAAADIHFDMNTSKWRVYLVPTKEWADIPTRMQDIIDIGMPPEKQRWYIDNYVPKDLREYFESDQARKDNNNAFMSGGYGAVEKLHDDWGIIHLNGLDHITNYSGGKKIADKNWVLTAYDENSADNGSSAISNVNQAKAAPGTEKSPGKGTKKSGDAQGGGEGMSDGKPLSKEELQEAIAPKGAKPKVPKKPANRVSIEEVMSEPEEQPKAEQKPADEGSKLVMDDDTKASEDILRNLLGIDDNDFDDSVFLREGDIKLTPAQRKQVYAAGVNYALWYIDNGFVKFDDFAAAMSKRLGEKIKPWLKSFYNGARDIPGYENVEFTPYEEVKRFDVANFDKPTPEMLKQAEMVLAEHKAKKAAAQAAEELKK